MQKRMNEHWHSVCAAQEGKSDVQPPGDFGFNHPLDYVINRCSMFLNYGILPLPGGADSQDETFLEDLETYMHGLARVRWERAEVERQARIEEDAVKGRT